LGHKPETKTIFASFSDILGVRANRDLQRIMDNSVYKGVFPRAEIGESNVVTQAGKLLRNQNRIETSAGGSFRNTTVAGSITGESLDLGIIDDPIKGRAEANSVTTRNKAWDWFTDDFSTRFSENAAMLMVLTRWHLDDPAGRLIKKDATVKSLVYKAIATQDEEHRKAGDPLAPNLKSLEFLHDKKNNMYPSSWESLYQQSPYTEGGNYFKSEWWQYYEVLPNFTAITIYADTAQKTKKENDYSVFQIWGRTHDRKIYLIDLHRERLEAPDLLTKARAFYNKHQGKYGRPVRSFKVEDKSSGTGLIQTLKREGIPVIGIPRDTDKVTRAMDASPSVQAGMVYLPKNAPWLLDYISEHAAFPNGEFDDQVDPTIDAIMDNLVDAPIDYSALM
jgi:predicted phage terminase large subunit-like protein